ncbi:MAG: hypothetical protein ACF8MF_08520 [Phycisphaerales bacterium JB052]
MNRPTPLITVLLMLPVLLLLSGCSAPGKVDVSKLGPPPSAQELAERHNARIAPLDTLWARVSVRAKGTYDDGTGYEEQGEGHLQIQRPGSVSLSIGKLGETYFVFGASPETYWSFNLADADHKVMLAGDMDRVTRAKASALGLPVHPSEIIALSGLSEIDLATAGGTQWRQDGQAVGIRVPGQWGSMMLWFDQRTGTVVQAQAYDAFDELIATAELSRYKDATIPGERPVLVPGKIEITTPNDDGFVRIELSEPQRRDIRPMVFQPDRLRRGYRVHEVIDLDEALDDEPTATEPTP